MDDSTAAEKTGDALLARVEAVEREYRKITHQSLIVDDARKAEGRDGDVELTYGTTSPRLALRILREVLGCGPGDVFYDLGCGLGVPTVVAALVCARATGIDVLPQLLEHGRGVARTLNLSNARFVHGDLRAQDLGDGTAFYSYSTCLLPETRAAMAERIAQARPGARAVTVTHALDHPALERTAKLELRWGATPHSVFLHVRR